MNTFFHPYGLMVGIGIISALSLSEIQAKKHHFSQSELWRVALWLLIGGVIGARVYHVVSEYEFYSLHMLQSLFIWEGGLSIIGGVLGGVVTLWLYVRYFKKDSAFLKTVADVAVFGLPFGQAIGRVGNYFNYELYGIPTNLPWGIFIPPEHRVAGFEMDQRFHPLFLYEMIGTLLIGGFLWWAESKKMWKVGSGEYVLRYVIAYSTLRFLLDFIRVDKHMLPFLGLGTNQCVLLGILFCSIALWRYTHAQK